MSIESLLKELVSSTDGVTSAIVMEADGEAVQWCAADGERLRLRGAYVSVLLRACNSSDLLTPLGNMCCLVLEYEGATIVAERIDDDCFVAIELERLANVSQAIFCLQPAIGRLRREIGTTESGF